MIQSLLNIPGSEEEWARWAWAHQDHHNLIRQAILKQGNVRLNDYQINPVNFDFVADFLQRNQQLHNDMNTTLGTQGNDLQQVDLKDKSQLESWISSHYDEHLNAATTLAI